MRIMSFSQKWVKLHLELPVEQRPEFTTFRYPRGDKDWCVGEMVQVFFKNRSPQRERLGVARIIDMQERELDPFFTDGKIVEPSGVPLLTAEEAQFDGFINREGMGKFMQKQYGLDYNSLFNKLTLKWEVIHE